MSPSDMVWYCTVLCVCQSAVSIETALLSTIHKETQRNRIQIQTQGREVQWMCSGRCRVISLSSPYDSFVRHSYKNIYFPLSLPVTAIGQTVSTQNLTVVKSLWSKRIRLLLSHCSHLSVVVRQSELMVCCVWVQSEFTSILPQTRC